MTTRTSPWDDIGIPRQDYNTRLVASSNGIPLYWGRDTEERCLFILELDGDLSDLFVGHRISVQGLEVDLRTTGSSQTLVLTLQRHVDRDIFFVLCNSLIESLKQVSDPSMGLTIALNHIKRWKAFLAGNRKPRVLSEEALQGLFAELTFMRDLRKHRDSLSAMEVVSSWAGVKGAPQDFVLGNTAVEVKSLSRESRNTVSIATEDQLQSSCDSLFLVVYKLSQLAGEDSAMSVNELVKKIEKELADAQAVGELWSRLAAYDYIEMEQYDTYKFVVSDCHSYHVTGDFPKLIRSNIPDGIVKLCYEIKLEAISNFEVELDDFWRGEYGTAS